LSSVAADASKTDADIHGTGKCIVYVLSLF